MESINLMPPSLWHMLTCSIATKFLPWGCLAECPVWRHSQWRHSAELRWQARSTGCSPARSLLRTSPWHCKQQCVKQTDRSTAQVINWLFGSRKSWGNKSVYLPKSCLRSSWALLTDHWASCSDQLSYSLQCRLHEKKHISPISDVNKSPFNSPRFKTKKLRCKLRCWPCWSPSSSQGPRLQRSWAEQR